MFQQKGLGATVNGTTYCGMRARTTGAPQNHWFGPCGDPRGAGIGLFAARRLARSMDGELTVKPRQPYGSQFVLRLRFVGAAT